MRWNCWAWRTFVGKGVAALATIVRRTAQTSASGVGGRRKAAGSRAARAGVISRAYVRDYPF